LRSRAKRPSSRQTEDGAMSDAAELRITCEPDATVRWPEHKHKCARCGTCWKHSTEMFETEEDFDTAHTCPGCGREVRTKHFASDAEMFMAFIEHIAGDFEDCCDGE
jgi:formate dehydrogenase maturation protein FdhE